MRFAGATHRSGCEYQFVITGKDFDKQLVREVVFFRVELHEITYCVSSAHANWNYVMRFSILIAWDVAKLCSQYQGVVDILIVQWCLIVAPYEWGSKWASLVFALHALSRSYLAGVSVAHRHS